MKPRRPTRAAREPVTKTGPASSFRWPLNPVPAAAAAAFGWLVPGGGYLLLGRKRQFAVFLLLVSGAFGAGLALDGGSSWPRPEELQGLDGFSALLAQAGTLVKVMAGGPYLLARLLDYSQSFLNQRLHEYGSLFLVVAGLLNLLALADAWELRKAEQP